jgi:prepilin peptidase CpaA
MAQWIVATSLAMVAGWLDWRSNKIPNWLTVSGLVAGVVIYAVARGWAGLLAALSGAALMLGVLLPVVLLRGLGAGDWKLMGALGSILGWRRVLAVLLASIALAALLALVQMIRERRVRSTLVNLWELLRGFVIFGLRPNPGINLDNSAAARVPFGVAAAAATVLCFATVMAGR